MEQRDLMVTEDQRDTQDHKEKKELANMYHHPTVKKKTIILIMMDTIK